MQTSPESASPSWADGYLAAFGLTPAVLTDRIKQSTLNLRPAFWGLIELGFDQIGAKVSLRYQQGQIVQIEIECERNGAMIREAVRKDAVLDLRKLQR